MMATDKDIGAIDGAELADRMHRVRDDPRTYLLRFYPQAPVPPLDHVVRTARPLQAQVTHGLWIALCDCGAPDMIERGAPKPGCVVFFEYMLGWCIRCQNAGTGRGWRPITAPDESARKSIAAILACRPNIGDRNWELIETIDDLISQNKEHGDTVPKSAGLREWARMAMSAKGVV